MATRQSFQLSHLRSAKPHRAILPNIGVKDGIRNLAEHVSICDQPRPVAASVLARSRRRGVISPDGRDRNDSLQAQSQAFRAEEVMA
jgi:hypothetical protein